MTSTSVSSSDILVVPSVDASLRSRVDELLSRMTLDEKVGQMTQLTIGAVAAGTEAAPHVDGHIALDPRKLRRAIVEHHVGSLLNVLHAAPSLEGWHALITEIQDVATKETRLGIPVLYGVDFVHGANYVRGGTIFPHNLGMAATFDDALVRHAGAITALEAAACALPWNFAPVLDVGRQPLWPRFYETFGEDTLVTTRLGAANVQGMQGCGRIASTMKHYLAYGVPRSGRDRTPAYLTEREIREHILPPFREAVRAGARALMVNSGEIDGEPLHASRYWLTDVLRGELGFQGVVVTDWHDIVFLHERHRVARTMADAIRLAIDAGVDMSMTPFDYEFAITLTRLVREGTIAESRIDESVRRILTLKASLGLLDTPYPTPGSGVGTAASRDVARQAARESITVLKNEGGSLPLARTARILVTGPTAASHSALHGGWTYTWQGTDESRFPADSPTLLDAIRKRAPNVTYVAGAGFDTVPDAVIAEAVEAARQADVALVALGEEGYAEWVGDIGDLTLPAAQLRLAHAIEATGTPVVLVLLEGRPRIISTIVDDAKGIVLGYWPGMEGAEALAEVLFGEVSPSGRLPFTYPRSPNALTPYDHRYTETLGTSLDRATGAFEPQFDFGHGLSYTTFACEDLRLPSREISRNGSLSLEVTVRNTGQHPGAHVLLVFTRQHFAALTPPVRRLRGFDRVVLAPGDSRVVTFTIPATELGYIGRDGRPRLDVGDYDVMVDDLVEAFRIVDC